jgi:hypothetical protein
VSNIPEWFTTIANDCAASEAHIVEHQRQPMDPCFLESAVFTTSFAGLAKARSVPLVMQSAERSSRDNDGWYGSWKELSARIELNEGSSEVAQMIERSCEAAEASATFGSAWHFDVAGDYPVVPLAIGGDPMSMRRKSPKRHDGGLLTVFVPMTCSAAVQGDDFAEILALILASLRAISIFRPVQIVAYTALDAVIQIRKSRGAAFFKFPVSLQYSDFKGLALLADPTICRNGVMNLLFAHKAGYQGQWPWNFQPDTERSHKLQREALGVAAEDVYIPPLFGRASEREKIVGQLEQAMRMCGVSMDLVNRLQPK